MKILHVVDSLDPGGMENGVVNASGQLMPPHEIGAACLRKRGAFADRLPPGALVRLLGKTDGFSWSAVRALRRLAAEWRPNVLHTHSLGALMYAALATRWGRAVPICHGEHSALWPAERKFKRMFQRRTFYKACRVVHTVSSQLTSHYHDAGFHAPGGIRTVRNGVDCIRFQPAADRSGAFRTAGILPPALASCSFLGIVGRIIPTKRHVFLLDAFDVLAAQNPHAALLIIGGDGGHGAEVQARIDASPWKSRIVLAGHQDDPVPFYQLLDLLVIPSSHEGMSNAMLEAMACAVPVLAHQACGCAEVIRDGQTGFLRAMSQPAELAAHLGQFLGDPDNLRRIGASARADIQENFSLAAMARQYLALYEECAASKR
jgi:glycosyltransferase involved in cell wall biosynthesis